MTKHLLCIALLVALLIGCAPQELPVTSKVRIVVAPGGGWVERFIDEEAGVVCWLVSHWGITCLPICCTNLGGSDCDDW